MFRWVVPVCIPYERSYRSDQLSTTRTRPRPRTAVVCLTRNSNALLSTHQTAQYPSPELERSSLDSPHGAASLVRARTLFPELMTQTCMPHANATPPPRLDSAARYAQVRADLPRQLDRTGGPQEQGKNLEGPRGQVRAGHPRGRSRGRDGHEHRDREPCQGEFIYTCFMVSRCLRCTASAQVHQCNIYCVFVLRCSAVLNPPLWVAPVSFIVLCVVG